MSQGKKSYIELLLSQSSTKRLDQFLDRFEKVAKVTTKLQGNLKQIDNITKAITANNIGYANMEQYLKGIDALSRQRVKTTIAAGNAATREATSVNQVFTANTKLVGSLEKQKVLRDVDNKALTAGAARIGKINSLEQVRYEKLVATNRIAKSMKLLDEKGVNRAQKYLSLLNNQEQVLKAQAATERRINLELQKKVKLEAKALRIQEQSVVKARQKAEVERNRPAKARADSRQRLFGDGGANLFGIQAGLLANYVLLNGLRQGFTEAITFAVELDRELRNLQAITVTTDGNMATLKTTLVAVSEATKFTALEVAQAAVVLGQAGLSIKEIENAVPAVALLATATGTDLGRAVDIATSTLGVFNLEASRMGSVADTMTAAVNGSKLNIEKLTLGLQYSGNIASQSGVQFEELTAALGAMANAGIRSGSTLGTGMRQILIALKKPSAEFKSTLDRLGITMYDVDVRSQGLYGAFKNLQDAGFTAGDAIRSFEVRAASAYNALNNNLDQVLDLQASFLGNAAAMKANDVQMLSLSNQAKLFGANFKAVAEIGLQPFVYALRDILKSSAQLLSKLKEYPNVLRGLTVGFFSVGVVIAGLAFKKFLRGLTVMLGLSKQVIKVGPKLVTGLTAVGTGAKVAGVGVGVLGLGLRAILGPISWIITAVTIASAAFTSFGREQAKLADKLDVLQTSFDNATGAVEEQEDKIKNLDGEIELLLNRYDALNQNNNMLKSEILRVKDQFGLLGEKVLSVNSTLDELIETLLDLREEMREDYILNIKVQRIELDALIAGQADAVAQAQAGLVTQGKNHDKQGYGYARDKTPYTQSGDLRSLREEANTPGISSDELSRLEGENRVQIDAINTMLAGLNKSDQAQLTAARTYFSVPNQPRTTLIKTLQTELASRAEVSGILKDFALDQKTLEAQEKLKAKLTRDQRIATDEGLPIPMAVSAGLTAMGPQLNKDYDEVARLGPDVSETDKLKKLQDLTENELESLDRFEESLKSIVNTAPEVAENLLKQVENMRKEILHKLSTQTDVSNDFETKMSEYDKKEITLQQTALKKIIAKKKARSQSTTLATNLLNDQEIKLAELNVADIMRSDVTVQEKEAAIADIYEAAERVVAENIAKLEGSDRDRAINKGENNLSLLESKLSNKTVALGNSTDTQEIERFLKEQIELANQIAQQRTDLANLAFEAGGMSDADLKTKLHTITADNLKEQSGLNAAASAKIEAISKAAVAVLRKELSAQKRLARKEDDELSRLIDEAVDPTIVDELSQSRVEQAENSKAALSELMQNIIDAGGSVDGTEMTALLLDYRAKIAEIKKDADDRRGDLQEIADDIAQEATDVTVETLEADRAAAQAAFDAAIELANYATTQKDRATYLEKAMVALKRRLKAMLGIVAAESTGDNPELDALREELALAKFKLGEQKITKTEDSKLRDPNSGSGGGRSNPEKTQRKLFEARIEDSKFNVDAGLQTAEQGVESINSTLTDAQAYAEGLTARIETMRGAAEEGTLSTKEQEKLNNLVKERSNILAMIHEQEYGMLELQYKQGDAMGAMLTLTKQWAIENLSINETFTSGFLNVLGSIKSGMTELFTSISNGSVSAGQAMKNFALTVLKSLQQMITELLVVYILKKAIVGMFGGRVEGLDMDMNLSDMMTSVIGGKKVGGDVKRKAVGGDVVEGNLARDSVPHLLMPGEFVLRKSAVDMIGVDHLRKINARGNNRMATGGHVGAAGGNKSGSSATTNVYVVSPDQQPVPGPNDIIAIVADDMARGGQTKKLVKSIQSGGL